VLENQNTVAWLTPYAAIVGAYWMQPEESCHIYCIVDGNEIEACAHSSAAPSEIVDVVLRLLASSVVHSVSL
jgi:hypothetical protein